MALFQSKQHSMVINFDDVLTLESLEQCLRSRFYDASWCYCPHVQDYDHDGQLETPHAQLFIEFGKRFSTSQIIREFQEYYGYDKLNVDLIHDKQVGNKNLAVKYVLHLTESSKDKTPHNIKELVYNDSKLLEEFDKVCDFDFDNLSEIITQSKSLIDVYKKIGDLNYCARNRNIILDLCFGLGVINKK